MLKTYTCIVCPVGCDMEAEIDHHTVKNISGNKCPKGKTYVENEIHNPMRTIATSVYVINGEIPLVSVRVDQPIPKKEIFNVMEVIKKVQVKAPVKMGDIIIENINGLGVNVIATKTIK